MSTQTPIEIVRAQWDWTRADYTNGLIAPHGWDEYDTALASVLADAERFKALELAHDKSGECCWAEWWPVLRNGVRTAVHELNSRETTPLAEIADVLRAKTASSENCSPASGVQVVDTAQKSAEPEKPI